jgi:hypothetical protein
VWSKVWSKVWSRVCSRVVTVDVKGVVLCFCQGVEKGGERLEGGVCVFNDLIFGF